MSSATAIDERGSELVISRLLDAPLDLVYRVWTDPAMLATWWAPKAFTNPVCEVDLRVGGSYRVVMRAPDGTEYPMSGIYREIEPGKRLVSAIDIAGHPPAWQERFNALLAAGGGVAGGDGIIKVLMTVTFEERGGKTLLTVVQRFDSAAICAAMVQMGAREGWGQSVERLVELLSLGR